MHTQSILSARFMFIPLSFLAFALFPLASTSPIGTGDPAPCVSTQGWTSQWIAEGQKNGVTFCGDSSADDGKQGSTTPSTSESSSPSSTASSNLDYPNTSTTPKSSTSSGAGGSSGVGSGALPHSVSSGADSGTNTTGTDTSGSGSGTGDKSGRRKKPCTKPKGTSSGGDSTPVVGAGTGSGSGSGSSTGSGAGTGAGMGAGTGTGTDVISSSTTTSSALSSSSTLASGGSSSVSVQGQATGGPGAILGAGSAPTLTLQNGDNNTASSSASQPTSATVGDGKTYQATITRYTDNCANQVGACGFLGTPASFQCAMSEFWTSPGMPGQCGTCWKIFNGTMANGDGLMADTKTNDIVVMATNTCAYYSGDPTGSCSQTKDKPNDRWGSVVGVDLCKDTGASAAFWGAAQDDQGGIAVATIQQVDCDQHWQGDLSPKTFTDWTKYQASAGKSLEMKPGTPGKRRRWG